MHDLSGFIHDSNAYETSYLPYCFFNIISPLMTILVAALGWKIPRRKPAEDAQPASEVQRSSQ